MYIESLQINSFPPFNQVKPIAKMDKSISEIQFRSQKKRPSTFHRSKSQSKKKSQQKIAVPTVVYMIISDEEGAVSIPYQLWAEPIKTFIKRHGATWCPVFKVWKTSKVQLQYIKRDLPSILTANYEDSPAFVRLASQPITPRLYIKGIQFEEIAYNLKNHELYQKLYPFQRQTLEFCLSRHGRILIADQMGVGKTLQSLACNLLFPQKFPLLVICPSALKHVWRDEVLKWYHTIINPLQVFVLKKGTLKPGEIDNARVVIVSYEIAVKLTSQLKHFDSLICDEAHYLKNPESNRCSQLVPFITAKKRIFLLTGTPALAKPRQLFNLLKILRSDLFTRLEQFGQRYCYKRRNPWSHKLQYDGGKNLAQLHYLLKKTVMIRRLKSDVLSQLPSKQRQIIYMETEKSVVAEIKEILRDDFSVSSIRQSDKLMSCFGQQEQGRESQSITRCYMLSATAKLQSIKQYISAILQNDIKVIIFAHHKFVMDQLQQHLKNLKYAYIRLDGEIGPETRKKKVDLFQEDFNIKVALLSVTAMGTGFTLTAASTVIFAELHWTPAILIQAEDRSHRIGQKNAVNIHYLIGDNTLDPIMLRQLQRKIGTVAKVLDGQDQNLNIEVLKKGQIGTFQIPTQQIKKEKMTKITDYFSVKNIQKTQKNQTTKFQPQNQPKSQMKDESLEKECKEKGDQAIECSKNEDQDSDQSLMLQFLRRKRMQRDMPQ